VSRSQSKAEYGRYAHLFVGGIEWLLSQWQALTGGEETDLHSHAAGGGGSGVRVTNPILVSAAELGDLAANPKVLVLAQGADTLILPVALSLIKPTNSTPFTVEGAFPRFLFGGEGDTVLPLNAGLFEVTTRQRRHYGNADWDDGLTPASENQPLLLANAGADMVGGDASVIIVVAYLVV
jgi:hypothetical protein